MCAGGGSGVLLPCVHAGLERCQVGCGRQPLAANKDSKPSHDCSKTKQKASNSLRALGIEEETILKKLNGFGATGANTHKPASVKFQSMK